MERICLSSGMFTASDPTVEYPDGFDEAHNIRFMNVTKWIVDPKEDSLEKLVNVYDVLADEDCNIALVFNRTSSTTNVYLAVVDVNNTEDNHRRRQLHQAHRRRDQRQFPRFRNRRGATRNDSLPSGTTCVFSCCRVECPDREERQIHGPNHRKSTRRHCAKQ